MKYITMIMLAVVGLIHLLPVSGVIGNDQLLALYGIPIADPNLEILLRHRALLFGLLGAFMIWAAFKPVYQPAAFLAGFFSVASFMAIAWTVGDYNQAIGRVFLADVVAIACLFIGLATYLASSRRD